MRWLVIGYGSDLRGDDGLGRRAALAVAALEMAGATVMSVHQLTPELAEPLAGVDGAIFLDAHPADAALPRRECVARLPAQDTGLAVDIRTGRSGSPSVGEVYSSERAEGRAPRESGSPSLIAAAEARGCRCCRKSHLLWVQPLRIWP